MKEPWRYRKESMVRVAMMLLPYLIIWEQLNKIQRKPFSIIKDVCRFDKI